MAFFVAPPWYSPRKFDYSPIKFGDPIVSMYESAANLEFDDLMIR